MWSGVALDTPIYGVCGAFDTPIACMLSGLLILQSFVCGWELLLILQNRWSVVLLILQSLVCGWELLLILQSLVFG